MADEVDTNATETASADRTFKTVPIPTENAFSPLQDLNEDLTEETVEDGKEESESNPVTKNEKPPPIFINGTKRKPFKNKIK
ncbi:hypothetical protein TKK_0016830 [Trichogramma kaykai]